MRARAASAAERVAATLAAAASLALSLACEKLPDRPRPANPLDPNNPSTAGAPFRLRAAMTGHDVTLTWESVPLDGRSGYRIYRRTFADDAFSPLGTVGPNETASTDTTPPRDSLAIYVVTILNERGEESPLDESESDSIDVPPLLQIGPAASGLDTTSVRDVLVRFHSPRAQSAFLADTLDAADPLGLAQPVELAPDPNGYAWLLTRGQGFGGLKGVYGRVLRPDGSLTAITFDTIRITPIRFAITVDGRDADTVSTGRRAVTVAVTSAAGAESLEVTFEPQFLGAWIPLETTVVESLPGPGRRLLRARVVNDFGIVDSVRVVVNADTLARARISLNAGAAQTRDGAVTVSITGGTVTAICLTNDPIAADSGLAACAGGFEPFDRVRYGWPLDPAASGGFARVFAFLANDWDTTGALVDSIFFVDTP